MYDRELVDLSADIPGPKARDCVVRDKGVHIAVVHPRLQKFAASRLRTKHNALHVSTDD